MTTEPRGTPAPRPLLGDARWVRALQVLVWAVPAACLLAGALLSDRARVYRLEEAARWLRSERQRGDLIVLGDGIGRQQHFEKVPGVVSAREPAPSAPSARVFTLFAADEPPHPTIAGLALPPPEWSRAFGPYRVQRHRLLRTHLQQRLASAEVRFEHRDGRVDGCRGMRPFEFQCPLHGWLKVEPTQLKVADREEECIGAHPATEGTLRIRFAPLPLSERVVLRTAMADTATPPPVRVEVRAGDAVLGAFEHKTIPGWEPHELPTGPLAGTTAPVELRLSVPSGGRHHFCFSGGT